MRSRRQIKKRGSKNARNARQRKLEILNAMLEKKVLERTDELRRANEKLVQLARHDALTGLANRLYANERLREEFLRMKRTGCCYSVLMIDVDHFKRINDSYGHLTGDRMLRAIASTLRQSSRESDFVARFGGEEFLVILPNTTTEGAACVAEKIRAAIADLHVGEVGRISVSIGVATASGADNTEEEAVQQADQNLYRAKLKGRNRVEPDGHGFVSHPDE